MLKPLTTKLYTHIIYTKIIVIDLTDFNWISLNIDHHTLQTSCATEHLCAPLKS